MEKLSWTTRAKVPLCFLLRSPYSSALFHFYYFTMAAFFPERRRQTAFFVWLMRWTEIWPLLRGISSTWDDTQTETSSQSQLGWAAAAYCNRQWGSHIWTSSTLCCVIVNVRWHGCVTGPIQSLIRLDLPHRWSLWPHLEHWGSEWKPNGKTWRTHSTITSKLSKQMWL